MPTPNFHLPLINGASPINIVNDMNALATAIDSALGSLATQAQIAEIKQIAQNAQASANDAAQTASNAKGIADAANTAATTAQATAVSANGTANSALSKANTNEANATNELTFSKIASISQSGNPAIYMDVLFNASQTKFKCYGFIRVKNGNIALQAIPGSAGRYGYKIDCNGALVHKFFELSTGGLSVWDTVASGISASSQAVLAVGSDGNLYACVSNSQTINAGTSSVALFDYPACIYINSDLGDHPTPAEPA